MLNKRTWQDDLAELHAIAQADDSFDFQEEGSEFFISLSAAGDSTKQLSALRPVSLDPAREKEYLGFFFPKDSAKSGGGKEFLLGAFQDMADVTNRLNAFFGFMRAILIDGRNLFRIENDPEALQQRIEYLYNRSISEDVHTANADEATRRFLSSFMTGQIHSVIKSDLYDNGIDVSMSGGSSASDAPFFLFGNQTGGDRRLTSDTGGTGFYSTQHVENERLQSWSTALCLKVQRAAKEILEFLYGSSAISHKLQNHVHPINTKFDSIEEIFEKHTGLSLPKTMVRNMSYTRPAMDQFIAFDLFRFPSKEALKVSNVSAAAPGEDNTGLINSRLNDVNQIVPEAELLNGLIRATPRFTFEEDISRFITQAPEQKAPSMYVLNNWFSIWSRQFMRTKGGKRKSSGDGPSNASLKMNEIPRYILPASSISNVTKARKSEGLVTENSRTNEDGIYLTPHGTIQYRPDSKVRDELKLASEYDALCEELYTLAGQYRVNIQQFAYITDRTQWKQLSDEDFEKLTKLLADIKAFTGTVISWDWDYGIAIRATSIPGVLDTTVQVGAKKPDSLAVADYMGLNLADPSSPKPVQKDFASAMYLMTTEINSVDDVAKHAGTKFGSEYDPKAFATHPHSPLQSVLTFYFQNVFVDKKFMSLQELAAQAMRNLGYGQELPMNGKDNTTLYATWFTNDGAPKPYYTNSHTQSIAACAGILGAVLGDAAGASNSSIYNEIMSEGGRISRTELKQRVLEHDDYFSPHVSPMHEFGKLYSYFGGQILKLIFDEINKLSPEELIGGKQGRQTYEVTTNLGMKQSNTIKRQTNNDVMEIVKPIAIMLGKYVPNKETMFEQARAQMESIGKNPDFTADELIVPGLQENRAVFPHQLDTQAYLRKKEPPPFAILAISPGGGKTGIGAMDMAALAGELQSMNTRVKPLVIAPDNLIKTWCDDIKYFLGDTWNAVPISTAIMNRWGAERLQTMLDNAPPNTIFITGMAFMSNARQNVVIGTSVVRISGHQEFIKRLAPNYIIIDESHKLKNGNSQRHKIVKAVTTATFVKWLRIASGTLMPNTPSDLEAQVNLYSPHIFRAGELSNLKVEDAEAEAKRLKLGGEEIPTWQAGTPSRALEKLGRYGAVVYKKRKEWAWMLPSPIESFHGIPLVDRDATGQERADQELHEQLYSTVLEITEKAIKELFDKAKSVNSDRKRGSSDGDDEKEEKMDENQGGNSRADDVADGLPEGVDSEAFKEHMARFERLIIAPEHDPLYKNIFGEGKRYTSRKAKYIVKLITNHFNPPAWSSEGLIPGYDRKGNAIVRAYNEYDLVQYKGDWWLSRKFDGSTDTLLPLHEDTIGIAPDKNPDVWKKEPHGKVIVITRYNHSADAIYQALPPELRKQATVFTGDNDNKWKGFEEFKTDPRMTILIANEQGMSEGHNLQMASRLIRAESPWGPGELDQTSARIFRPDPKGATAKADGKGELYRDIIYLDWVLADNTMEVAKQARVISKVFSTTRIEESENPLYQTVFKQYNVPTHEEMPELGMGVEALRNRSRLEDEPYASMRRAYSALNGVERAEFNDMRVNGQAGLIPVEAQPSLPGSAKINAPFVANQDIPDPNGWKPTSIEKLISSNEEIRLDPQKGLYGLPVITDFGTGRICSVKTRDNPDNPVSSVLVKFKNPMSGVDETVRFDVLGAVYTPTATVSSLDWDEHFEVSLTYLAADLKKEKVLADKADELDKEAKRLAEIQKAREAAAANARIRSKAAGDKRKENIKEGKPINQNVTFDENVDKKIKTGTTAIVKGDNTVRVHPAFNHGYLTLEGEFTGPDVNLKKLGFKFSGEYAFLTVKRYNNLAAIFDYLEEHFELSKQTEARLNDVQDAFEPGKRGLYSLELAAPSTMPMFFATRKKIVTNRKEIRIYPIFMADELILAVDTATSPAIRKHIGKLVPGAASKWQLSDGHWFFFAEGKTQVKEKMADIKRNGYVISNEKEANKELAEIKFRKPRAPASK